MKKIILGIVLCSLVTAGSADETKTTTTTTTTRGEGAGYAYRDATALSMMGWGVSLAVGIAALVCLIPNHTSTSH